MTAGTSKTVDPGRWGGWHRPTGRTLFLAVLLVVLAVYSEMALQMEWRTVAGRIGPGFFPRIVGGLGILLTIVALVTSLRAGAADDEVTDADEDAGEADLGRHPGPLLVLVGASVALIVVFTTLGAIIACALFLAAMLFFFNRGHTVMNVAVSLGLPIAIYVLFQSLLNAGLPDGVLPRF